MSPSLGTKGSLDGTASNVRSSGKNLGSFAEDERLHMNNSSQSMQSPCYIHSRLDSVLESSRRDQSYFETHNNMPSVQQRQQDGARAQFNAADSDNGACMRSTPSSSTTNKIQFGNKNRPQPRHRGAQGAVEPESESDEEDGSDASTSRNSSSESYSHSSSDESENESDRVRSLTRQLAETAVGVREMSKQLGRATVKSTIQSVLIITKARDNHLIKLTRELAIWLMNTPRNGKETGLIVYVDAQLRQSKRFDAEGIKQAYPHLFVSSFSRRQSTANANADADPEDPSPSQSSSNSSNASTSRIGTREDSHLRYWTSDMCSRSPHLFDFVVTLGGDGTVLFCSWLFQRIVPPVMPFALGSLGFLTNFDYSDYKKVLESALDTGIRVNLRMRFTATVYRATQPSSNTARRAIRSGKTGEIIMRNIQEGGWNQIESPLPAHGDLRGAFTEATGVSTDRNDATKDRSAPARPQEEEEGEERPQSERLRHRKRDKEVMCFTTRPVETFEVLNDLVVDRGPSPYVSLLEVFGDEHHMTTAQADGLCISTPTGSTAYSLSAGGSLVHPEIPAILITPICPHTLSFRPMLLPDSMELRIAVPYNSRSTAWASFDGRGRVELRQGDHIKVTASRYPFPTVCSQNQSIDWFESISRTLKWNERQRQKSFVVVEEGGEGESGKQKRKKRRSSVSSNQANATETKEETKAQVTFAKKGSSTIDEDDEDDEDEPEQEVEEKFDIDDSSTVATRASSPDSQKLHHHHYHHHHHHHRRASGNSSAHSRNGSIGDLLSVTPLSSGSKEALNRLRPLTSTNNSSKNDKKSPDNATRRKDETTASKVNTTLEEQKRDASPSSSVDSKGLSLDPAISLPRTSSEEVDPTLSATSSNYQHGVVQPSNRSLLDSPDRFGLAGPPRPPRALSDRHLATADFRLDGGKAAEDAGHPTNPGEDGKKGSQKESGNNKETTLNESNSPASKLATTIDTARKAGALEEEESETSGSIKKTSPIVKSDGPSKKASKLYKKLRGKSKASRSSSRDTRTGDGLDLNRSSSNGTGAALVVYGQDQSDSDSTEEG